MQIALRLTALLVALCLAACSSIPVAGPAARPGTGPGFDYLTDDVAGLLLALDLPPLLEPGKAGTRVAFTITARGGEVRTVGARLVPSDAGELAATLPPPADQRNYYLFGFAEADRALIRDAQAWARTQPAGTASVAVALEPDLCRTGPLDPASVTVSVLLASPSGEKLPPLLRDAPLATLLAAASLPPVPPCPGHSG